MATLVREKNKREGSAIDDEADVMEMRLRCPRGLVFGSGNFTLISRRVFLVSRGRKEPWGAMNCSLMLMSAAGPSSPVAGYHYSEIAGEVPPVFFSLFFASSSVPQDGVWGLGDRWTSTSHGAAAVRRVGGRTGGV
jgi:hypothetical protein